MTAKSFLPILLILAPLARAADSCLDNLAARGKAAMVALTWDHDGSARYTIRRSTVSPGNGFEDIGTTTSAFSAFTDYNVESGLTYYYRVQSAAGCVSHAVSIVPRFRSTNRRPVFTSAPVTAAQEAQAYSYAANATDPEGQALTFLLDEAPAGMTIDAATGDLAWTPAGAQVGTHPVSIRAVDPGDMAVVQAFQVTVDPRPNFAPVARIIVSPALVNPGEAVTLDATHSTDADGDALAFSWSFGDGSQAAGEVVTHAYGAPGLFTVTLTADDQQGHPDPESAVIHVNAPPTFADQGSVSTPEDAPWVLPLSAPDADGHAVHFSLLQGPVGMTVQNAPGSLVWQPANADVGSRVVRVRAEDGFGGADTTSFILTVTNVNDAPIIFSTPPVEVVVGETLRYDVNASDPDIGDIVTYGLAQASGGAIIFPSNGLIFWSPLEAEVGDRTFRVVAQDLDGAFSIQEFTVRVKLTPQPPAFTSIPITEAIQGKSYQYQATASDPNEDPLTFALVAGPSGMTVTPAGLVSFAPGPAQAGDHAVLLSVMDGRFSVDQAFTLAVAKVDDNPAPQVALTYGPENPRVGDLVTFNVGTSDGDGVELERVWLLVNGEYVPVMNGRAEYRILRQGSFSALATAYDIAGNYGEAEVTVNASISGSDTQAPTADITAPGDVDEIEGPVDIIGTAADPNFAYFTLAYREEGASEYVEFHRQAAPVDAGVLGRLGPAQLENGKYRIRLVVFDAFGNFAQDEIKLAVSGAGDFGNFTISYTDMRLELPGIPVEVKRTYDSRIKTPKDFGVGWTLEIKRAAQVVERQDPQTGWTVYCTSPQPQGCIEWGLQPSSGHDVVVHVPGWPKQEFELESMTSFASPDGPVQGQFRCNPKPGTITTLEPLAGHVFDHYLDGELLDSESKPVDPTLYRLTLPDGMEYIIDDLTKSVTRITDPNGNRVDITPTAIVHSNGDSISLSRDPSGRIIRVQDADAKGLDYAYDGHGNLKSVRDDDGNETRFKYSSRHYLNEIIDSQGVHFPPGE